MARTIMVSNEIYEELKKRKGEKSFSETIKESLESRKTGKDLMRFVGILEGDTEYDEIMPEIKKMWSRWGKRLEQEMKE